MGGQPVLKTSSAWQTIAGSISQIESNTMKTSTLFSSPPFLNWRLVLGGAIGYRDHNNFLPFLGSAEPHDRSELNKILDERGIFIGNYEMD